MNTEIGGDLKELFLIINEIKKKFSTHVIITSQLIAKALKGNDRHIHIGSYNYFLKAKAIIYEKSLDLDIIEPLENMSV